MANFNFERLTLLATTITFAIFKPMHCALIPRSTDPIKNSEFLSEDVDYTFTRVKHNANEDDRYQMKFKAYDKDYDLKLEKPRESIFSPNFRFLVFENETEKRLTLRDATPTLEEIHQVSDRYLINNEESAVLSLTEEGGTRKIRGTIGAVSVDSETKAGHNRAYFKLKRAMGDAHDLVAKIKRSKKNNQVNKGRFLGRRFPGIPLNQSATIKDYIDPRQTVARVTGSNNDITPEILVILSHSKYNSTAKEMLDYVGILFHIVNTIWSGIEEDFKVKFKVIGIAAFSTDDAEWPINLKNVESEWTDIKVVLENLSKWVFANNDILPKHDMAVYVSGAHYSMEYLQLPNGTTVDVPGIAYLRSACYNDKERKQSFGVSIAKDVSYFGGAAKTIAHMLAHNMGAAHDGDDGVNCEVNEGFHMMTDKDPLTHGESAARFSKCSIKYMKEYISSSDGQCLRENLDRRELPLFYSKRYGDIHNDMHILGQFCGSLLGPTAHMGAERLECSQVECDYKHNDKTVVFKMHPSMTDGRPCGYENTQAFCKGSECYYTNGTVQKQSY